jgi:hypothetical protein
LVGALFETEIICNKTVTLIGFAAILRPIALIVDCQNGSWVRSARLVRPVCGLERRGENTSETLGERSVNAGGTPR